MRAIRIYSRHRRGRNRERESHSRALSYREPLGKKRRSIRLLFFYIQLYSTIPSSFFSLFVLLYKSVCCNTTFLSRSVVFLLFPLSFLLLLQRRWRCGVRERKRHHRSSIVSISQDDLYMLSIYPTRTEKYIYTYREREGMVVVGGGVVCGCNGYICVLCIYYWFRFLNVIFSIYFSLNGNPLFFSLFKEGIYGFLKCWY